MEWNPDRRKQLGQFIARLAPLLLAFLISAAALFAAFSPMIRQNLNRNATQALSGRFLTVVEKYFSSLFQFMSASSLWTRIGDIDSIGDPGQYAETLHSSLETMGSASSLSLVDSDNRELVLTLNPGGDFSWYETTTDAEDSLVRRRNESEIEYLNLSDVGEYSTLYGEYPAWFRFSLPYELADGRGYGSTIRATLGDRESERALRIWIDLPSDRLARLIKDAGLPKDAIVFLLLPGDEFLMFAAEEFGQLTAVNWSMNQEFVASALGHSDFNILYQSHQARFEYNGIRWRADYRDARIGTQDITLGVFVPVDSLWTTELALPVQLGTILILITALLLFYVLMRDFRRNANRLSDAERLRLLMDRGESADLEFKSSLRWDYRQEKVNKDLEGVVLKSVAAFSNSKGGTLLLGVDDAGRVLGLENDYSSLKEHGRDYFELHLRTLLIGQYGTDMASRGVEISFVELDGNDVCRLNVSRGRKPLYTSLPSKSGAPVEKFFVRSGNSSRAISSLAEITSYVVDHFGRRAVE